MSSEVDEYFARAKRWRPESEKLREILLECDLDESIKWGKPTYSWEGNNIAIIQKMKDFLSLMFFKGALIDDPEGLLEEQGANTRSALRVVFTDVDQVAAAEKTVRAYVRRAIEVERQGLSVPPPEELELVEELQERLDEDTALKAAFESLTPGRQRGYNIYFSDAKQSETRARRVEKYAPKILEGKGLRDP